MASNGNWTIYVPDRTSSYSLDKCLFPTVEAVRAALTQNGVTSVGTATATVDGDTIRFARPETGRKGN